MISSYEMELLKTEFNVDEQLIHYFPFIVDPTQQQENINNWPSYDERNGFMCIGNFKHPPNWDSVLYLKQQIWPLIRQQLPKAELFVYGAYPSPKVLQLHKPSEGFYIKGRAEEVKEVMEQARICLAPLRFGAGLKGKLLEAMEFGTPSITTTIGAEAMHDTLPWNGGIADQPAAFASAAVALYQDRERWEDKQKNGVSILATCFSPTEFEQPLIEKILKIKENLIAHRQKNFQGQMLKHHSMRSTKFMSLWIEEKNKVEV
jgi:glycosyltransferase involved in cell wall biosynthesis